LVGAEGGEMPGVEDAELNQEGRLVPVDVLGGNLPVLEVDDADARTAATERRALHRYRSSGWSLTGALTQAGVVAAYQSAR